MWKNLCLFVCIISVLSFPVSAVDYDKTEVGASACVLIEAESGRILAGQNIDQRLPMASTTKIMAAMLALEQPDIDSYFTVDSDAIHVEGSSMGLLEGDQVSLRMLTYGMILPSGNDAANATAVKIAGSIDAFVEMMNQRAVELELKNTNYVTVCGLDADEHYSSALDLAKLTSVAMQNPTFREICKLDSAQVTFGNPPYQRWLKNYNKLLTIYPECIGVKTGFTDNAKRCLVSAAKRDDVTLICVTLNAPDDWNIHKQLYENYLGKFSMTNLCDLVNSTSTPVVGNGKEDVLVNIEPAYPVMFPIADGEEKKLSSTLIMEPFQYAPIKEGDLIGKTNFFMDGELISSVPMLSSQTVEAETVNQKKNFVDSLSDFILQLKDTVFDFFDKSKFTK